jgi:hypothetical protein
VQYDLLLAKPNSVLEVVKVDDSHFIPREDERVVCKGVMYIVYLVVHDYDAKEVRVYARRLN